jgi:capsule biosynthesis phosphatase
MKKIVIDLDDTLSRNDSSRAYPEMEPRADVVATLRAYRQAGFEIAIYTARNMRTYAGNVGKINAHTLPVITEWLERHDIPYDEIFVGKPWCGNGGFYVDDKAIRPDEFTQLTLEEIYDLIGHESAQ